MTDSNWGALTDEQIERIAEKAADKAVAKLTDHVYREVGKGVVQKLFYIVGAITVAAFLWFKSGGWVK
jgi:hypothetical protein